MKRILALSKTMIKAGFGDTVSMAPAKTKKAKVGRIILFAFLGIYSSFFVGIFSYGLISQLVTFKQEGLAVLMILIATTIASAFFALLIVPGVFYFSNDVNRYLVLPLKSYEILFAKLMGALFSILQIAAGIILPFIFVYSYLVGFNFLTIFWVLIGSALSALLALSIVTALTIALFTFIPLFKNKDTFTYISTTIILVLSVGMGALGGSFGSGDDQFMQQIINSIANGDNALVNLLQTALPNVNLFTQAAINQNFLYGILGILLTILVSIGLIYCVKGLYFKSVIGIGEKMSKKKVLNDKEMMKSNRKSNQTMTLMKYDMRRIFRTPIFMTNYFLVLLIMPIAMFAPIIPELFKGGINMRDVNAVARQFQTLMSQLPLYQQFLIPAFVSFIIGGVLSSFSTLAATSFSREGKMLLTLSALPFDLKKLLNAKIILATLATGLIPVLLILIGGWILQFNLLIILFAALACLLGTAVACIIGIMSDLFFTRLQWENEVDAVKGNFFSIIPMFALMIVFGIIAFIVFKTGIYTNFNLVMLITFATTLIIGLASYIVSTKVVNIRLPKQIENL